MTKAKISGDSVRSYLRDIGRIPLLSNDEEILLGRQVQRLTELTEMKKELSFDNEQLAESMDVPVLQIKRELRAGTKAKEKMVVSNLRLVVSIAKKYTKRNMELLDIIQEGTFGLIRGVEKFDPGRGYKFSTYAYWWIRQGITRAIAEKSRAIRLPIQDRKSTRLNSSHLVISYAVFCLKKKKHTSMLDTTITPTETTIICITPTRRQKRQLYP